VGRVAQLLSAKAPIDSDANVHPVTINPDGGHQDSMVWREWNRSRQTVWPV
jgi:hypothetical protein